MASKEKKYKKMVGILIVGLEGSGKSFVGNLLCPEPKPFKECEFSANLDPPSWNICQTDKHRIVDSHPTMIKDASRSFSKGCPLEKVMLVFTGVVTSEALNIFIKNLPTQCPQPSKVIIVHNMVKPQQKAVSIILKVVQSILEKTTWHYVDVEVIQLANSNHASFAEGSRALLEAAIPNAVAAIYPVDSTSVDEWEY